MKRIEASAEPVCTSGANRLMTLLRQGRFEGRLVPLQYLAWLGIALTVGLGVAALGVDGLSADDVSVVLSTHFLPPAYLPVFLRLCLSLLPPCLVLMGAGLTYPAVASLSSLPVLCTEGFVAGVCVYQLLRGSHPITWFLIYALWILLRLALLTFMAIQARGLSRKRQEARLLADTQEKQPVLLIPYAKLCLTVWLCGVAVCATVGGLYLLL